MRQWFCLKEIPISHHAARIQKTARYRGGFWYRLYSFEQQFLQQFAMKFCAFSGSTPIFSKHSLRVISRLICEQSHLQSHLLFGSMFFYSLIFYFSTFATCCFWYIYRKISINYFKKNKQSLAEKLFKRAAAFSGFFATNAVEGIRAFRPDFYDARFFEQ